MHLQNDSPCKTKQEQRKHCLGKCQLRVVKLLQGRQQQQRLLSVRQELLLQGKMVDNKNKRIQKFKTLIQTSEHQMNIFQKKNELMPKSYLFQKD